jgi:hypothetical protein
MTDQLVPMPKFKWVDGLEEPFYSWWMACVRPKRNVIIDDLLGPDAEKARLVPDVDPKKKLEEATDVA